MASTWQRDAITLLPSAWDPYLKGCEPSICASERSPTGAPTWEAWLVDDQCHAASRPDVLVYKTEPLKIPLRMACEPIADIVASTSGGDSDWVVKIIHVWPDEVADHPKLRGYQQMLSADILRGRYRLDPANPQALEGISPCPIASACPMPTTHSCPAIVSWCKSSQVVPAL